MIVNFADIAPSTRYHLLTQTIIPRPIAWVLSENDDQSLNLAPFSFFNAMCSDPPLMVLSVGKKPDGEIKDTRRNILSGRDFLIHIAHVDQADMLNKSAAALDYGESELEANDLALAKFEGCPIPRLAQCNIAYQCSVFDVHEIGPNQQAMIYAEVKQLYLNDAVFNEENNRFIIDPEQINPLTRLGGSYYAALDQPFSLTRPK
ncbi:MAG: flavin reductase family protein [Pseudomonadota bacterium]